MATKKTTIKPISLGYRPVGSLESVEYIPVMGVLKGLSIAQDAPDENNIEAEFFDSPFEVLLTGKPIKLTFDLVNYKLSDLPELFGGTYTAATATDAEIYVGASAVFSSEKEWKLGYQSGNNSLVIYRGKTIGTIKNENGGALSYSVTITSLVVDSGTDSTADDKMYAIIGDPKTGA